MADLIRRSCYVFFSQPSESSKFIRENMGLKNVFSMPSELSTINVFSQFYEDEEKESNSRENKEEKKKEEKKTDMIVSQQSRAVCDGMFDDMRMHLQVCANDDMTGMEGDMRMQLQDRANDDTDDMIEISSVKGDTMDAMGMPLQVLPNHAIRFAHGPIVDDMRMRLQTSDDDAADDIILKSSDMRMRLQTSDDDAADDMMCDDKSMQLETSANYATVGMTEISSVKGDTMGTPRQSSAIGDKEMQQNKQPLSRLKYKLMEQEHGPNMDFHLLKDTYDNVFSASKTDFLVSDNAIFKQRTPLGNTVLHLAAGYGNDAMIEKVAQHAPQLFTAVNNNYDTALHVAAKKGHGSTIKLLLNKFLLSIRSETNGHDHQSILEMMLMLSLTLFRNKQGNTFLHVAFITSSHNGAAIFQAFEAPFITNGSSEFEASFKRVVNHLAPFAVNVEERSLLYMAIDVNCKQVVNQLLDFCVQGKLKPQGKSALLPALIKSNSDMLGTILSKRGDWIHLRNEKGWYPLHYAAFLGNLQGVSYLVRECPSCTMERDNKGYLPIHLACIEGHVKIFQELLKWCIDPAEMVNDIGQNLLHIACKSGNYEVVRYLLKHPNLEIMINQKDFKGNTPLHLATSSWRSKIVHALTWDNKVDLSLLNHDNQTALDIAEATQGTSVSLSQRLTWNALKSAGTPRSSLRFHSNDETEKGFTHNRTHTTEQYKDRIDTLIVVSTLIITTSFAAGFTIPGDVDHGIPVLLNRHLFHLFILSLTFSLFGAISSTIILLWARLGDLHLAVFALTCAVPLLGFSLMTLSIAFLAGMYLIVSKLSWLATTFLVIGVVLILVVEFLYLLLWLPSTSSLPFFRYISYYPFLFFAKIAEGKMEAKKMGSKAIIPVL